MVFSIKKLFLVYRHVAQKYLLLVTNKVTSLLSGNVHFCFFEPVWLTTACIFPSFSLRKIDELLLQTSA